MCKNPVNLDVNGVYCFITILIFIFLSSFKLLIKSAINTPNTITNISIRYLEYELIICNYISLLYIAP